jgi:hypothetical protein
LQRLLKESKDLNIGYSVIFLARGNTMQQSIDRSVSDGTKVQKATIAAIKMAHRQQASK